MLLCSPKVPWFSRISLRWDHLLMKKKKKKFISTNLLWLRSFVLFPLLFAALDPVIPDTFCIFQLMRPAIIHDQIWYSLFNWHTINSILYKTYSKTFSLPAEGLRPGTAERRRGHVSSHVQSEVRQLTSPGEGRGSQGTREGSYQSFGVAGLGICLTYWAHVLYHTKSWAGTGEVKSRPGAVRVNGMCLTVHISLSLNIHGAFVGII